MLIRRKVFIKGNVQGIGFRYFVRAKAELCKVNGYVRNLMNGDVEAVFEGDIKNIKKLIDYCKTGPLKARVNNIEIKKEDFKNEFSTFRII